MQRKSATLLGIVVLLFLTSPANSKDTSEEFSIISYNTHGLPSFITHDDTPARLKAINPYLVKYDVVLIQENFSYPDLLTRNSNSIFFGNPSRFSFLQYILKPICGSCGSGLVVINNKIDATTLDTGHRSFGNICTGWFLDSYNCFVTKGFMFVHLLFRSGENIYVYNLHLNSGGNNLAHKVRINQLDILIRDINQRVRSENGLIIGGDFNERPEDLKWFLDSLKLKNSFEINARSQEYHKYIDNLFYRSGSRTIITPLAGGDAKEIPNLSDHRPIFSTYRVEIK
ncbi:MAG: hypothetical protein Q8L47_00890 [bacterium]|nr:hypothetical protein [bacterium]